MATDTTTQQIVDVVTPAAGESVTEGTVLEWHVKVGEQIKADETIVEISTDKVDVELPSPASGTVTEILVAEGDTVTVGQVIARIAVGGGAAPAADTPADAEGSYRLRVRCEAGKWRKKLGEEKIYKYFTVARRSIDSCDSYEEMGEAAEFMRDLRKLLPTTDELYTL